MTRLIGTTDGISGANGNNARNSRNFLRSITTLLFLCRVCGKLGRRVCLASLHVLGLDNLAILERKSDSAAWSVTISHAGNGHLFHSSVRSPTAGDGYVNLATFAKVLCGFAAFHDLDLASVDRFHEGITVLLDGGFLDDPFALLSGDWMLAFATSDLSAPGGRCVTWRSRVTWRPIGWASGRGTSIRARITRRP